MWWRFWCLLLLPCLALAQDEDGGEEEDDPEIIIDGGEDAGGKIEIKVDPFEEPESDDDPNKPAPVQVGTWQPPELKEGARAQLDALLARRGEQLDDPGIRYRLAEFYFEHRWFPQAEAEFLACAQLDPESVRPWEGLLRVYRARPRQPDQDEILRVFMAGGNIRVESEPDWLPSEADRRKRMTHAFREIVKRRPDDVARRRAYLQHLKQVRDWEAMREEARNLLRRLPGDADTRFDLAEALRKLGEREGADPALGREAFELLEENLRAQPDHAASALRLARMIAVRDGQAAGDRVAELERRAVFSLFVRPELAVVAYRADTFRMVRDLIGPRIANRLWDEVMTPAWFEDSRPHYTRWINAYFPHAQPRDRIRVLQRLARRGGQEAAGILLSFLWHFPGPEYYQDTNQRERHVAQEVEDAAVASALGLGSACFEAAKRFLKQATTAEHRRRAMGILRGLKDPRAVRPLLDALAWDVDKDVAYGVAPTLEELGDPQAIDALVEAALDVRRPLARRREAVEALAAFKDARSVEAITRLATEKGFDLVTAYGLFRLTGDERAAVRIERSLQGEEDPAEVVRLLAKCDDPRVEGLLLVAV
ncbi:MAG: HEAT repeat domain-containing protein, partial [Planctomycetota bacterium]